MTVTERGEGAQKKNWWTKIGRAFPDKSGEGFTVVLDALPLPGVGGSCRLFLKPHKEPGDLARDRPHAPGEGGVVATGATSMRCCRLRGCSSRICRLPHCSCTVGVKGCMLRPR